MATVRPLISKKKLKSLWIFPLGTLLQCIQNDKVVALYSSAMAH